MKLITQIFGKVRSQNEMFPSSTEWNVSVTQTTNKLIDTLAKIFILNFKIYKIFSNFLEF